MDKGPIARVILGDYYLIIYWDDLRKMCEVYNSAEGSPNLVDTLSPGDHGVLEFIGSIFEYADRLNSEPRNFIISS